MLLELFIQYILPPILGAIGWLATQYVSKSKRKNDAISELNGTIEGLVAKYTQTLAVLVEVRKENANLIVGQAEMQEEIKALRKENAELRIEIEQLNERLANVRTITRNKA